MELGESADGDDCEEMAKKIRLCKEDLIYDLKWQWDCYESVARID
jgi:hypothetical protein